MLIGKLRPTKKNKKPADEEDEEPTSAAASAINDDDSDDNEKVAPSPPGRGGIVALIATVVAVTIVAGGAGTGLGMQMAARIAKAVAEQTAAAAQPASGSKSEPKISGDMVVKQIDPVITNLASPSDTWIRLETAMVFKNGAIENPDLMAADLRQDMVAYARTMNLAQLEGPSALQHLREDLNERAALRSDGHVSELIIQTLVVQ